MNIMRSGCRAVGTVLILWLLQMARNLLFNACLLWHQEKNSQITTQLNHIILLDGTGTAQRKTPLSDILSHYKIWPFSHHKPQLRVDCLLANHMS